MCLLCALKNLTCNQQPSYLYIHKLFMSTFTGGRSGFGLMFNWNLFFWWRDLSIKVLNCLLFTFKSGVITDLSNLLIVYYKFDLMIYFASSSLFHHACFLACDVSFCLQNFFFNLELEEYKR